MTSPRLRHPRQTSAAPDVSLDIVLKTVSPGQSFPATPFDATIQLLSFNARVPEPGMQLSNYASDAIRSHLHLPNTRVIDVESLGEIEFDGEFLVVIDLVIAVRESDIPPNPDDDDECTSSMDSGR
jgi:hypothetical protein